MKARGWYSGVVLSVAAALMGGIAQAETSTAAGATAAQLIERAPIHWVSIAQIEKSLEGVPPMNVGFDIDDTVLFSSPGFYRGIQIYGDHFSSNPEFWQLMNNGWDAYSLPKEVGRELIAMHLRRHDHIYFITARAASPTETVTPLLQKTFNIPANDMHPVIFTGIRKGENTKIPWLSKLNIKLYYGDADSDIEAANAVHGRGIRVLRAANSTYMPHPQAGALGEEVIVGSDH